MDPFDFPEQIECPECGKQMDRYVSSIQIRSAVSVLPYAIYHCTHCGYDHLSEKRWECVEVTERRYFHG